MADVTAISSPQPKVLITGTAGFIGFHLAKLLLSEGMRVHGYDGMSDYYDVALKRRRHAMLKEWREKLDAEAKARYGQRDPQAAAEN